MEGVASGMAVASLALQLLHTVKAIDDFVKAFKDAPRELIRLQDLLGRLASIAKVIRASVQLQSSQSGTIIPLPLDEIEKSLTSCEKRINPLKEMVEKYQKPQLKPSSKVRRFKLHGSMAIKTADINEIEDHINREINIMSLLFSLNQANISIGGFMASGSNQQSEMSTSTPTTVTAHTVETTEIGSFSVNSAAPVQQEPGSDNERNPTTGGCHDEQESVSTKTKKDQELIFPQRRAPVRSALELFGVRQHKVVHTLTRQPQKGKVYRRRKEEVLYEEHVYSWASTILRHGVSVIQKRPYGSLLPSLSVYPVVSNFWDSELSHFLCELRFFVHGEDAVFAMQRMIAGGMMNPLVRDAKGDSLLHVAAECLQPEVYRLLIKYGVKPDYEGSTFEYAMTASASGGGRPPREQIDTLRTVLEDNSDPGDAMKWEKFGEDFDGNIETINWLWSQRSELLWDVDAVALNMACFRAFLRQLTSHHDVAQVQSYLTTHGTDHVMRHIQLYPMDFLKDLFRLDTDNADQQSTSWELGSIWLRLLQHKGVNLDLYIQSVVEETQHVFLKTEAIPAVDRKVIIGRTSSQCWMLGWEWVPKQHIPGAEVLAEFCSINVQEMLHRRSLIYWPFGVNAGEGSQWDGLDDLDANRFLRRMDRKARKEAKASKQRSREAMPGAWID